MQISSNMTATSTQAAKPPPPPKGGSGGPPSHGDVVAEFGASLSQEVQDAMLETISSMESDGASHEEIKSYVDSALEEEGLAPPDQRPGMLLSVRA